MSGGTSAELAMAVATSAKGVVSGRAATDCHSRSAHRWRVSSARVRKSPASTYRTQSASAAATAWPSAPQRAALAMRTFATWSPVWAARRADRMPRAQEKAAMRSYRSSFAVDKRARAISLDASAVRCLVRWTTARPS